MATMRSCGRPFRGPGRKQVYIKVKTVVLVRKVPINEEGRVWLGLFYFVLFFDNKFINVCLKGMHIIYCLGLYKGNYFSRELGFVCRMPERKHQPQCSQQSFQSQQEELSQQQDSPQLCFITNLPLVCFYPPFGTMSVWRDWVNFNITECYDSK